MPDGKGLVGNKVRCWGVNLPERDGGHSPRRWETANLRVRGFSTHKTKKSRPTSPFLPSQLVQLTARRIFRRLAQECTNAGCSVVASVRGSGWSVEMTQVELIEAIFSRYNNFPSIRNSMFMVDPSQLSSAVQALFELMQLDS